MEAQIVGAVLLGAVGATGALTALARRGAAPWLRAKEPVKDTEMNGELLDCIAKTKGWATAFACFYWQLTYEVEQQQAPLSTLISPV